MLQVVRVDLHPDGWKVEEEDAGFSGERGDINSQQAHKSSLASRHSRSQEGGEFASLFVCWTVFCNSQIGVAECGEP